MGRPKDDDWGEGFDDADEYDGDDEDSTSEEPSGDADLKPVTNRQEIPDKYESVTGENEEDDDTPLADSENGDEPDDNTVIDEYNDDEQEDKKPRGIFRFRRNNSRNIFGDSSDDKKFEEMLDDLAKYRKDKADKEQ